MEISQAWLALIGTVFGGVGLKIAEKWLSRNKDREDTAAKLREELRTEVYKLREELRQADESADKWRQEYFDLKDQIARLKDNLRSAIRQIREMGGDGKEYSEPLEDPTDK